MSIAVAHKKLDPQRFDRREIQYLLESCRDVAEVALSGRAADVLSNLAKNSKIQSEVDYEALKQVESCGNPEVLLGLQGNKGFIDFSNRPIEMLKRNLKNLENYLIENPGMVDGVVSLMGYIITNIGRDAPEFREPLIYELPPKGSRARSILSAIEKDLVRYTESDLEETKLLLS